MSMTLSGFHSSGKNFSSIFAFFVLYIITLVMCHEYLSSYVLHIVHSYLHFISVFMRH